ncbi:MAG: late competence development ComFB family protein [Spirochaetia bacterium]|jgi:competence protein ComFB
MGLKDLYDFDSLVNEAERTVLSELEAQMAVAVDICRCQDCVLDMAAYALNNVKPTYRVSLMGSVYARAVNDLGYAAEISRAVADAIKKIKANPSHD